MALSDILERIERDGSSEADAIVARAEEEAARILGDAKATAEAIARDIEAAGDAEAERVSSTVLANARLAARDRVLQEKRAVIERVLQDAIATLRGMPDDAYASLFASRVANAARGGETLLLAAGDRARLESRLQAALAAPGAPAVAIGSEDAPVESGGVLAGERMSVDLSIEALVAGRADEISARIATMLFAEGEA